MAAVPTPAHRTASRPKPAHGAGKRRPSHVAPAPGLRESGHRPDALSLPGRQWSRCKDLFRSSPTRSTGAMMLVAAVVFGLVLLNISVAQTSFQLADLQRQAAELQAQQRRLRYEVAKAEAPDKIVEMSSSLGLVPPPSQQYLEGPSILVGDTDGPLPSPAGVTAPPDSADAEEAGDSSTRQ